MDSNGNSQVDPVGGGGQAVNPAPSPCGAMFQISEEDIRRCSIGSASSLMNDNGSQGGSAGGAGGHNGNNQLLGVPGAGGCLGRQLSIRRVSEISHINELRREVSGMEHLGSEYYEISREPNPDNISLDSIHKTVFRRCQNKYIPPQRTTTQNKCFVVVTSGFTILGIIYGFWYKNFGPGKDSLH